MFDFVFISTTLALGVGLAMDALSVSFADGLHEPGMKLPKATLIAGTFAFFQGLMPLLGWFCVHTLLGCFKAFEPFIPWIALILLAFIGGKMLYDGLKHGEAEEVKSLTAVTLFLQGIATSIDALSLGFTNASYNFTKALIASLIIAAVTFIICFAGIQIGKRFGTKLSDKASILGGSILIIIGIEIFITGIF